MPPPVHELHDMASSSWSGLVFTSGQHIGSSSVSPESRIPLATTPRVVTSAVGAALLDHASARHGRRLEFFKVVFSIWLPTRSAMHVSSLRDIPAFVVYQWRC